MAPPRKIKSDFYVDFFLLSCLMEEASEERSVRWNRSTLKGATSEAELFGSADVEPLIMSALLELSPRNKLATEKKI